MTVKKYLLFLLLATFFGACSPSQPEEVAVRLLNALTSGDMSYVKENLYFSNRTDHDAMCDYLDLVVKSVDYKARVAGFKADYRVVRATRAGNEAWVELRGVSALDRDVTLALRLLFIDGKWVVDGNQSVLNNFRIKPFQ